MKVWFYPNFSKRRNSTKRPDDSTATVLDVVLKGATSVERPTFIISKIDLTFNYCWWEGSFYFIDDITLQNNSVYEISCSMDPLATFKTQISSYTAFVERASSSYDSMVPDGLLSSQNDVTSKASANTELGLNASGIYQMLVSSRRGIIPYAFADPASAAAFYNASAFKSSTGTVIGSIDSLLTTAGLQAVNLQEYMGTMIWLPINPSVLEDVDVVSVGYWDLTLSGAKINSAVQYPAVDAKLVMPSNQYNDFRKADNRFSRYSIYLPGVGLQGLNAMDAAEDDLWVSMRLDCYTGSVYYRIYHGNTGADVAGFTGMLGVQMPCGGANYSVTNTILSSIGTATAMAVEAATENYGALALSGTSGAVNVASAMLEPQGSISGGNGNIQNVRECTWIITSVENFGSKEFPTAVAGRPLYQNVKLSSLSGYVKCGNASIDMAGFPSEKDAVNSFLNSGFYLE